MKLSSEQSSEGITAKLQNLELNKIVIGQFLTMKNKLGTLNIIEYIKHVPSVSSILNLSKMRPDNINMRMVEGMIAIILGVSFTLITLFSEARKRSSLINVVAQKNLVTKGTVIKVNHMNIADKTDSFWTLVKYVPKLNPPLIPSQKTKFQNLSLVSQDSWFCCLDNKVIFLKSALISFIRNLKFIICQFIISKLYQTTKQIRAFMLIFSVVICINTDCLANISTNLGTNEGAIINDSYSTEQVAELIGLAEAKYQIPTGLLTAIAKIESSVRPYALNIGGRSMLNLSKSEAATIASEKIKQGVTNIDIGVMQLNWRWHGNQFANVEEMLDVSVNVGYAAKLLRDLYKQHNDWHKAVRYYHSATGEHHRKYSRKVVLCWLGE